MYFVADKPIQPGSLLDQFANGDDAFRNSRFKLIPSIVEVRIDLIRLPSKDYNISSVTLQHYPKI